MSLARGGFVLDPMTATKARLRVIRLKPIVLAGHCDSLEFELIASNLSLERDMAPIHPPSNSRRAATRRGTNMVDAISILQLIKRIGIQVYSMRFTAPSVCRTE